MQLSAFTSQVGADLPTTVAAGGHTSKVLCTLLNSGDAADTLTPCMEPLQACTWKEPKGKGMA